MKKFVKETSKKLATGALAVLATIGSASAANLGDLTQGDISLTGGSEVDTGTIPVYGYQTSKVFTYELNVTWGNMQFVFDRGVYNPNTDRLTKKVRYSPFNWCEAGAVSGGASVDMDDIDDTNGVGKWCGFDGTNNHVTVVNKGNGNVQLGVGCTEGVSTGATSAHLGSAVDLQVAVATADATSSTDGWTFTGTPDTTKSMRDVNGNVVGMTIATGSGTAATTTIQKYLNLDGTVSSTAQDRANEVVFYLNITGEPTPGTETSTHLDTSDEINPSVESDAWEEMGKINLTFTPSGDTPRTPDVQ